MNQKILRETSTTSSHNRASYGDLNQRAYDELAAAIIMQAIKDHAPRGFFVSDYYQLLTTNMPQLSNGEAVYEQIMKNRAYGLKHGIYKEEENGRSER